MSYAKNVMEWERVIKISQDANTMNGGDGEELSITVHTLPGVEAPGDRDKFIVLSTEQWALDVDEIDKFAEYLKSLCK